MEAEARQNRVASMNCSVGEKGSRFWIGLLS